MAELQKPRNTRQMATQATSAPATQEAPKQTMTTLMNAMLDGEGYRRRFDDLLGKRTPQFVSSIISIVNASPELQRAFRESPITLIQAALTAATFDLPITPSLGYAYIVPFNNSKKLPNGTWEKRAEATFILGYKGMNQLALRTGAYKTINVVEIREGELKSYNRLTEEIQIDFIEDEDERATHPIIGWAGYFKLINGTEKTIYMSRKQITAHELKNRKPNAQMGKGWRENFDEMAMKTVFRRLIGRYGLMSIDYQKADASTIAAAEALATADHDDIPVEPDSIDYDTETGEVTSAGGPPPEVAGIKPPFE
ncbi:MAG: recombinase RecT [Kiritimatiellales bacterium]